MDTQGCGLGYWTCGREFWRKSVICLIGVVVWLISLAVVTPQTADAFNPMIHSSLSTGSSKWDSDWGTTSGKYGEFTCGTCHDRLTGNIKRVRSSINSGTADPFPNEAGLDSIVFTTTIDGSADFGDDAGGHADSTKICEACHSQNKFHNYDTADNTANGGDLTHANQSDCISCHKHSKGFGASCDACHGNPPITADVDGSTTTGLVHDPSPTGATNPASAGAHDLHGVTEGMSCNTCHKGNTMPTVSMTVQMGFEVNATNWSQFTSSATGGNLDAPQDVDMANGYTFISSDGGTTTITKVANHGLNCTVYCHGNWVGSGGSNTTPSWVGSSGEAACGTCHGISPANPPTAGSHPIHAGNGAGDLSLSCNKCHPTVGDETHLDGDVAWELDTADSMIGASATYRGSASGTTGGKAPSVSYGDCSSTYCHGSSSPTWGGSVSCGDCHAVNNTLPISHDTHYGVATTGDSASDAKLNNTSVYVYQCGSCHDNVPHADGNTDVAMSATWGGTINGSLQCSNVYCHSDGVNATGNVNPTWAVTNMNCGSCHASEPASARHTKHTDNGTYNFNCAECHVVTTADGTSIADTFQHVDEDKDVDWDTLNSGGDAYTDASTACSNLYCHSNGQGGVPLASVQWDTVPAAFGCNGCHDEAQTGTGLSGAHEAHVVNAETKLGRNLGCEQCHNDTVSNSTTISDFSIHVDNNKDIKVAIDGTTCSNIQCHSNGNTGNLIYNNPDFAVATLDCDDCHGNGAGKSHPTYGNGGAGVNANSHLQHVETSSIDCGECHADTSTTGTSLDGATPAKHVDQAIDVVLGTGSWNGTNDQCSSIYCHSDVQNNGATIVSPAYDTPTWGGAVACGDCHGVAVTGRPTTGSHTPHNSYACSVCHTGAGDETAKHADSEIDVVLSATYGGTYSQAGTNPAGNGYGSCSSVSCHGSGTPTWGATGSVACGDCHGDSGHSNSDNRDGAPPVDLAGLSGSFEVGKHQEHLSVSFSNTTDYCNLCHSGAGTGTGKHADGTVDIVFSVEAGASAAFSNPGTGSAGTCSNLAVGCHGDANWDPAATMNCNDCHGFGGTDPDHVTDSRDITANCEHCHEAGHPQGITGTTILIPNNATVGINYSSGGIHLLKSINSVINTTEAETCWDCHDAQGTPVSEWGSNNNTNTGGLDYNYGSLGSSAAWYSDVTPGSEVGSSWSSGKGTDFAYKTGNIQSTHSANSAGTAVVSNGNSLGFNRAETLDTVDSIRCSFCHDVHNRNLASGDTLTGVPYLRGSWKGNPYPEDGAPRTGWSNWSREGNTSDYGLVPRGSASRTNTGKTGVANLGGYWIDQNTDDPNNGLTATATAGLCDLCHGSTKNGTWTNAELAAIDETTGEGLWISGYNGHANVVLKGQASDTAGPGRGVNGSGESYARNIFTRVKRGSTAADNAQNAKNDRVDMGLATVSTAWQYSYRANLSSGFLRYPRVGASTTTGTGNTKPHAYEYFAWNQNYTTSGSATHERSAGTMDLQVGDRTTTTDSNITETANYDSQANYHTFNCGKCHNPHASRLPKLMITNCLDTNHNSWDDDYTGVGTTDILAVWQNTNLSQWPSAQNCHRLDERASFSSGQSTARGTGWNKATPWLEDTTP